MFRQLIFFTLLIDLTVGISCETKANDQCLEHCKCFICGFEKNNETMDICFDQSNYQMYNVCDFLYTVTKPDEKSCTFESASVFLTTIIIILGVLSFGVMIVAIYCLCCDHSC